MVGSNCGCRPIQKSNNSITSCQRKYGGSKRPKKVLTFKRKKPAPLPKEPEPECCNVSSTKGNSAPKVFIQKKAKVVDNGKNEDKHDCCKPNSTARHITFKHKRH